MADSEPSTPTADAGPTVESSRHADGGRANGHLPRNDNPLLLGFGRFVFKYRDYLAPGAFLLALLVTRPRPFLGSEAWDLALDALGILVALAGQSVRAVVIGLAYIRRGGRKKEIAASRLVSEGIFAHCRNPLYVGNFLLVVGLALVWNSPWVYLVVLPVIAASLGAMVYAEEAYLSQAFGDEYAAYCRRVPRFLPKLEGLGRTFSEFRFDWKRVVRKDYGTAFSWTSTALLLIAAEKISRLGIQDATVDIALAGTAWVSVAILYAVARWLKFTHRIDSPA